MWLLNTNPDERTNNYKLEQFNSNIPKYAILSHRWEEGQEVTFQNIEASPTHLRGFQKIKSFCQLASKHGYRWVWVDTCCIDKKSSAELSEAINSMYKWYQEAKCCYVYLNDVNNKQELSKSSWFTRGWTLQELLAPPNLHFYNQDWEPIASRFRLLKQLERITGIPKTALYHFEPKNYCVATKMSWAASRNTSREEDLAYCLLGVFDINMPLLYGEGEKAFQRLEEEIMKASSDISLFFWHGRACERFGMLARDPSCFLKLPEFIRKNNGLRDLQMTEGWEVSNAGIRVLAPIVPYGFSSKKRQIYLLQLMEGRLEFAPATNSISNTRAVNRTRLGIFVVKVTDQHSSYFTRVAVNGMNWAEIKCGYKVLILSDELIPSKALIARGHHFHVECEVDKNLPSA